MRIKMPCGCVNGYPTNRAHVCEKDYPALKRHGERLKKRGISLCGYEKLTDRERVLFVKFILSLDSENEKKSHNPAPKPKEGANQ